MQAIIDIRENLKKLPWKKILIITLCLYLSILHVGMTTFNITDVSKVVLKCARYLCYIVFFINILITFNYSKNDFKYYILFGICGVVTLFSKDVSVMILLIILFSVKNISKEKLIKLAFYTNLTILLVTMICSLIGIIPNWIFVRNNVQLRYSLGYQFCTFASTYLFFIILARFYINKGKINYIESALMAFAAVVIYYFGDSRTGFILILLILLSSAVVQLFEKVKINDKIIDVLKNILKYVCYVLPAFLAISFIFLIFMYRIGSPWIKEIDKILTGRLNYTNIAIEKYGITLLGQKIKWQGWGGYGYTVFEQFDYNFVDNSNMKILLNYGIVSLATLLYVFTKKLVNEYNKKDYYLIYCLIIVLLWAFIEPSLLELDKNIFMLTFV